MKKYFFVDDDVILNDVEQVFEYNNSLFYKFRLSAGGKTYNENSASYKMLIKNFADIFDLSINASNYSDLWTNNHINAGQRMYVKNDFNLEYYEKCLKKFFENKFLFSLWKKRKNTALII